MSPEYLKKTFGDNVALGSPPLDTQKVLPFGAPEEVKEDVRKRLEIFMPGGGYVFSSIHNIQPDVSPRNIIAAWEALNEYGIYGNFTG